MRGGSASRGIAGGSATTGARRGAAGAGAEEARRWSGLGWPSRATRRRLRPGDAPKSGARRVWPREPDDATDSESARGRGPRGDPKAAPKSTGDGGGGVTRGGSISA